MTVRPATAPGGNGDAIGVPYSPKARPTWTCETAAMNSASWKEPSQRCNGTCLLAKPGQSPWRGSSWSKPLSTATFSRRVIVAGARGVIMGLAGLLSTRDAQIYEIRGSWTVNSSLRR